MISICDLLKAAKAPSKSYAMEGELYLSKTGWLMLRIPHSIVRGVFSTINEQGIELPHNPSGKLEAHIGVMRPEEIDQIGGAEKITERGKTFSYTLGPLRTIARPEDTSLSRVWHLEVNSPTLQALRRSYGLNGEGKFDLHITVAVRRKNVLSQGQPSKVRKVPNPFKALTEDAADAPDFSDAFAVQKSSSAIPVTVASAMGLALRKVMFTTKTGDDKNMPVIVIRKQFSVSIVMPRSSKSKKEDTEEDTESSADVDSKQDATSEPEDAGSE